jgi:G:T-mismatch repair DNA endonuclease (very short patch repair protein)
MILDYFNVNLVWKDNIPKIKFTPIKSKVKCEVPRRPNSNMPYSAMEQEYYTIFGDSPDIDILYQERKSLAAKTRLIEWYINNFDCDNSTIDRLNEYVVNIKSNLSKSLTDHYKSPAGKLTKEKLKKRSEKWAPIIGEMNKKKWNDSDWVDAEMNRRYESGQYLKSKITNQKLYQDPEFMKKFIKAVNNPERIEKISTHSKMMWQSPEYVKKILGQARNKSIVVNGYKMNIPESVVANILNDIKVDWKYEQIIKIDKKTYIPDFLINDNIIVEVFGDFWHANPNNYSENDVVYSNITAKQIWERDLLKQMVLEKAGYKVYIIWQDEINTNYEQVKELLHEIH